MLELLALETDLDLETMQSQILVITEESGDRRVVESCTAPVLANAHPLMVVWRMMRFSDHSQHVESSDQPVCCTSVVCTPAC